MTGALTNAVCARLAMAFDLAADVAPAHQAWAASWRYVSRGKSLVTMVPAQFERAALPSTFAPHHGGRTSPLAGRRPLSPACITSRVETDEPARGTSPASAGAFYHHHEDSCHG